MIYDCLDETVSIDRSTQVAIVGAGPAGMTLARELSREVSVVVIEGGGFECDAMSRELLVGECSGLDYPLATVRARQFGGASALWAGYCALFDSHDFDHRSWIPGSGWPFGVQALQPHYEKTANLLNLGEFDFDVDGIMARFGVDLPFEDPACVTSVWRFGAPTARFGEHLREEFSANNNLLTLINANVVDIRLDAGHAAVTDLVLRTVNGRQGRIYADCFVLAGGGIETPRLLLHADSQIPHGIGNRSGLVGRFFMEHPHRTVTNLRLGEADFFRASTDRCRYARDREFMLSFALSPQAQAEARVLNARAHLYRTLAMSDADPPRLGLFMEQAPNWHSRVSLSSRTDVLGMRRPRLEWQLGELDGYSFEASARLLAAEFARAGAGRVGTDTIGQDDIRVLHSNHQLGTTRMSTDPASGVVDAECRLHDVANLYVIGGSVFPTVGAANPTFTVLALTFRLAEALRKRFLGERRQVRIEEPVAAAQRPEGAKRA